MTPPPEAEAETDVKPDLPVSKATQQDDTKDRISKGELAVQSLHS